MYRELRPDQRSELWIGGPEMADPELIFHTDEILLEAPNWSRDGRTLYVNGHGVLWALDVDVPVLREVPFEDLPEINNDHVLAPDGASMYLSAYVSFPAGTLGHPADLDVVVHVISTEDWSAPLQSYGLFGGQGTLNVNSWSPDSDRFAFIAYPMDGAHVNP